MRHGWQVGNGEALANGTSGQQQPRRTTTTSLDFFFRKVGATGSTATRRHAKPASGSDTLTHICLLNNG